MSTPTHSSSRLALSLAAIGVVFGDIGTSPLYALRACFTDVAGVTVDTPNILGVLSLTFWSLALVISVKYVSLILRADHRGEGGVLALTTLILSLGQRSGAAGAIAMLGLVGCALFYGDGVITPAVTVLGAVEGLEIVAPGLEGIVMPLSLLILVALFSIQRRGTGAIGRLFGPMMVLWFGVLGALGLRAILAEPRVLAAVDPSWAVEFFLMHRGAGFAVFGAVFLAVTGGEALYADLGHFGRQPIVRAWFAIVWPALLLNYFGQGALLMQDPSAIRNPFYLLAPQQLLVPLVLLATAASVIASQAVISGVFAITQQCQQLGYIPRVRIEHSSEESIGQVYVPVINWMVCGATLALAIGFGSSAAIANAYGVGVSCTMLIDSVLMLVLLSSRPALGARLQMGVLGVLLLLDLAFVLANLGKVPTGGWFPILFGLSVFGMMRTWQAGRELVSERIRREGRSLESLLARLAEDPPQRVPGVAVFLASDPTRIPRTLVRNLKLNGVLHENVVVLTILTERVPRVMRGARVQVEKLAPGLHRVIAHSGFMELPNVPRLLKDAERAGLDMRTDEAVYFLGRDDIVIGYPRGMARWRKQLFLFLQRNSQASAATYGVPSTRTMEVGGQIEI